MTRIRPHLTYANVMVTLLAFVVLGGGAYAVTRAPKNSVVSKSIKNGQVKTTDLAKNAVISSKVKNGSLLGQDFASGQLPSGSTGPRGPIGATGPHGVTGPKGATGAQGVQGPGATSFATTVPVGSSFHNLETIAGINVQVRCAGTTEQIGLTLTTAGNTFQASGTWNPGTSTIPLDVNNAAGDTFANNDPEDIDFIARNSAVTNDFTRFDVHTEKGATPTTPCPVWGMITPSTFGP